MAASWSLRSSFALALALVGAGGFGCGRGDAPAITIRLAEGTTIRDTGLDDVLLPAFRDETGIDVRATAVGSEQALKLGERGDADVVLAHSRAAEDAFLAKGFGVERRDVWWNRFVVVGPSADTVGVREATSGADALGRIRASRATFVSRGDGSGTHKRELALWGTLVRWPGYLETGQGQGPTLVVANEKNGYALADEGTYLKMRRTLELVSLFGNDAHLVNTYGVIVVRKGDESDAAKRFEAARRFAQWLTGPRAQGIVRTFLVNGERAFYLPGETPAAR